MAKKTELESGFQLHTATEEELAAENRRLMGIERDCREQRAAIAEEILKRIDRAKPKPPEAKPPIPRGVGAVKHPPDALKKVRKELAATTDPARRLELQRVIRDLKKG